MLFTLSYRRAAIARRRAYRRAGLSPSVVEVFKGDFLPLQGEDIARLYRRAVLNIRRGAGYFPSGCTAAAVEMCRRMYGVVPPEVETALAAARAADCLARGHTP